MQLALRLADDAATDDDLLRLANLNAGYRFERTAAGIVLVTPPAGAESSRLCGLLFARIERWNDAAAIGYTFESSAGFRMPDGAVLSPDVSWVRKARYDALPHAQRRRFPLICPDLVVEVRSPSDDLDELLSKIAAFRTFGASIALLFDPMSGLYEATADGPVRHGRAASFEIAIADAPPLRLRLDDLYDQR